MLFSTVKNVSEDIPSGPDEFNGGGGFEVERQAMKGCGWPHQKI